MTPITAAAKSQNLRSLLKARFGFDSFLPLQEEIVTHVLSGQDGLALMPTGGGKSLCYQLPALALDGVTLVVSPLIALMKDQVDGLKANGVPAEFLNSSLSPAEAAHVRSQAMGGALKVLYIAPERLTTPGFDEFMRALDVSLLAIDEAHCISEWGHDFRPDYRNLKSLRDSKPGVPMLALTATATPRVREDIINQLALREPRTFLASFNRPNLTYRVEPKDRAFDRLLDLLRDHSGESAIVYCFSRRDTERIAGDLRANGISALAYHAGLDDHVRRETQERFIRDEVEVIAATIAFGMGIDKPDVRLIVHYSFPKTIEGYYQETGRAGRDGLPSECVLFYSYGDKRNHDFFIGRIEDASERERAELKLHQAIDFYQTSGCRRRSVLRYFGEQWDEKNCGACDFCLAEEDQIDATVIAQKILSAVIRTGERFGAGYVIDVLRGSKSSKVVERGHDQLSVHGVASDHSTRELRHFVAQLTGLGLLAPGPSDYPTYRVTEAGREFLHNRESLALARPQVPQSARAESPREDLDYDHSLFQRLRELRKRLSDTKGVPPYVVFGDRSLQQMARHYPQSSHSFSRISGVGEAKLEEYGEDFLRVIREFAVQNQLHERPIPQAAGRERRGVRTLSQTWIQTRDLLKQGMSIEDVSKRRGLAPTTVIGHMERLAEAGEEFDVSEWLPSAERRLIIEAAFHQTGSMLLGPVHEALDNGYSYEEIRLVRISLALRRRRDGPVGIHPENGDASAAAAEASGQPEHKSLTNEHDAALFQRLRRLRKEIADGLGVPAFVVFSDATLREMASVMPTDHASLLEIKGVGESKLSQFGDEFISAISSHTSDMEDGNEPEKALISPESSPASRGSNPKWGKRGAEAPVHGAQPIDRLLSRVEGRPVAIDGLSGNQQRALRSETMKVLATLRERESHVLSRRFGLIDGRIHTLQELAVGLGVSRERIRQIEAKALRKLRHPTRLKPLRASLEGHGGVGDDDGSGPAITDYLGCEVQ